MDEGNGFFYVVRIRIFIRRVADCSRLYVKQIKSEGITDMDMIASLTARNWIAVSEQPTARRASDFIPHKDQRSVTSTKTREPVMKPLKNRHRNHPLTCA